MPALKNNILYYLGLITAIWFALTGMVWVYWAALFIAYPVGLTSFFLWISIRQENSKRVKLIPMILVTGLILSIATLLALLIWD